SFPAPGRTVYQLPMGTFPNDVVLADMDDNGTLDIVVAGRNNDGFGYILFGQGGGAFGEPVPVDLGTQGNAVVVEDLDGDGDLDLAFSVRSHLGRVAVLFNSGGAVFPGPPVYYRTARLTEGLGSCDIDDDGDIDL